MSTLRIEPDLLLSPTPESESLALRIVRSQNRFLGHTALWICGSVFFLLLNLIVDGLRTRWSLVVIIGWAVALGFHWLVGELAVRRRLERVHRQLGERWRRRGPAGEDAGAIEIRDLREKLLAGAEAARESLRPISPEATADVSRGEARALDLVAWLDEAEPLLSRSQEVRALRRQVAKQLSQPLPEADRKPLERLLTQLDLLDVKLAVLEREASRRRSVLESFLLVLESAGVAGSKTDVLTAVSDPLRGRVRLLEETLVDEVSGASAGEQRTSASERIHEEVRLARELQSSILPQRAPEIPGLVVAHLYRPSSEVGGDFFDFYQTAPGHLLVAVGDASGHGLDSSMMSSMIKSALYTLVSARRNLVESMVEMNRMMCDTVGRRRLMTLVLLEIDVAASRVSWVNAGHVFPMIARQEGLRELETSSYPLGVRREVGYSCSEAQLEAGDRIVVVTDGCIEALDPDGDVYGWERLGSHLAGLSGGAPRGIVNELARDVETHLGGKPPQDDMTLVVIAFEP